MRLTPLTQGHSATLFEWASQDQIHWRWQGLPRSQETFAQTLWQGVLVQYLIESIDSGIALGHAAAYNHNILHGYCHVQLGVIPAARRLGWPLEAGFLMINHLFADYRFHKVYGEATTSTLAQFKSGTDGAFEVEGCLKGHVVGPSGREDLYVLALSRDRWEEMTRDYRW